MDINKIINIVHSLKEEGMTVGTGGFSGSADPKGPVAGYDPGMGFVKERSTIIAKGRLPGARTRWKEDWKKGLA